MIMRPITMATSFSSLMTVRLTPAERKIRWTRQDLANRDPKRSVKDKLVIHAQA